MQTISDDVTIARSLLVLGPLTLHQLDGENWDVSSVLVQLYQLVNGLQQTVQGLQTEAAYLNSEVNALRAKVGI